MTTFDTSDLGLAAALALTYTMEDVDESNPRRMIFYFSGSEQMLEDVKSYLNGTLKVSALNYQAKYRQLKARTYQNTGFLYR